MTTWHVYPVGDVITHDTDTDDCPCGPTTTPVVADDGTVNFVSAHHSLDGREFHEPDYAGAPMRQETP